MQGLDKRYGATLALNDVSLELAQGEVLALLGDNGAGKSTLINILSGVVRPDKGTILIGGDEVPIDSPVKARRLGIETVYQDLALFDNLDAVSNFYAGREPANPSWLHSFGWVNDRAMSKETDELLERLQVNVQKNMEIGLMSGGQRQAVACARAMAFGQSIVILDEPTSALGARESGNVLRLIKEAPDNGLSVILISHNLEHVMKVADRAVVLRQGRYIGEAVPDEEHHEELVSMIVGGGDADDGSKAADSGSGERDSGSGERDSGSGERGASAPPTATE